MFDERRFSVEVPPPIPPAIEHVWEWFHELHRTRDAGFAPERFKNREIEAWTRLRKIDLKLWELSLLDSLDAIWMKLEIERQKKAARTPGRGQGQMRDEAPAHDPKAVRRLLKNLAAAAGPVQKRKKPA